MAARAPVDVLIVSLGSTTGLRTRRRGAGGLAASARARASRSRAPPAAASCARWCSPTSPGRGRRGPPRARCRRLAAPRSRGRSSTRPRPPRCCGRRPGAIRFDAPSAGNRPGRHGLWQRPLERRRLARAPLLLPLERGGLAEVPAAARAQGRALVLPLPVEPSGPPAPASGTSPRSPTPANPAKKGLDRVLAAWRAVRRARRPAPATRRRESWSWRAPRARSCSAAGHRVEREPGVRASGGCPRAEYRALLRRARVFVCAPRREDYGIAQLEALADGCLLVSTPAPGPYAALPLARELDARLVDEDLAGALRCALEHPDPARYAARAPQALAPFARAAIDRLVAERAAAAPAWKARPPGVAPPRAACWRPAPPSARRAAPWRPPSACSRACPCGGRRSRSRSARPPVPAARACTSERSRRSGFALISSIVPVRARPRRRPRGRPRRARAARSAGRSGGRSRRRADARRRRSCARSSPARSSRRRCGRSRSPSRAAPAARRRSRASRRGGC